MAVTHPTIKAPGQLLHAVADWNAGHIIDGSTGEILFREAGGTIGTDTNLFWNDTTKEMAIGGPNIVGSKLTLHGGDLRLDETGTNTRSVRWSESSTTRASIAYFYTTNSLNFNSLEDGNFNFIDNNANKNVFRLTNTEAVFNEDSQDIDFRIESDNLTHAFFVEGSSGKVGIGTSSPSTLLHLKASSPELRIEDAGAAGQTVLRFADNTGTLGAITQFSSAHATRADDMRISVQGGGDLELSGGNVGIGTSSPDTDLHVIGDFTLEKTTNSNAVMILKNDNGIENYIYTGRSGGGNADDFVFQSPSNKNMDFITTGNFTFISGKMGVGITLPQKTLHVYNAGGFNTQFRLERAGQGYYDMTLSGERLIFIDVDNKQNFIIGSVLGGFPQIILNAGGEDLDTQIQGDTDANLLYVNAGTDRVGVSTAAPFYKFQVHADTDVNLSTDAIGAIASLTAHNDANNDNIDLVINATNINLSTVANVGISVADPHSKLEVAGAISSATLTTAAVGPTDNLNVANVNTVFIDCSGGNVTIGGFSGGVEGQILYLSRLCAAANNATLEHNEPHAFQKIFLHRGLDETLTGEYGGWTLVCNGTHWFDLSHAKHV